MVNNKTFWIPVDHVKVTFYLLLERISIKYENLECLLAGVGLIKLTALYSIYDQNQPFFFRWAASVIWLTILPLWMCASQALVSFKKYMLPPLPYFKVNICPLPLPHFASIFPYILSLTQLYRYTPEIFLFSTATFKYKYRAPHQTNWTRIFSESRIFYFSVNETYTVTSSWF
jgi:hypothetical protein